MTKKVHGEAVKATAPYRVTTPVATLAKDRTLTLKDRKLLGLVLVIAMAVRFYNLAWPNSVVFDEVHFGGFARKYVIGRFFMDVHPPLAKMLFAVVAWIGGYDGEFLFDNIGAVYTGQNVPYVLMRMLPSVMGVMTIALLYATLRASGVRSSICAASALLLTFENTHATESRYILLDSPLLFFVALSAYGYKKFENEVPFTRNWYRYLTLTGLGLATTVSSKWVGLFTIAWVGVLTVYQLWWLWGDLSVPVKKFLNHFVARAVLLIALPIAFYTAMFYLHFFCVDNTGDGADFMPRTFQANLKHNDLPQNIPVNVGFGSQISLRHVNTNGGYLHSHDALYETGSKQQQITLYPHMDDNNLWVVENGTDAWAPANYTGGFVPLVDGSIIRLQHRDTKRRLHSHDHRAPVTTHDYVNEVSCYGYDGFEGDANDNWRVKIIKDKSTGAGKDSVQALRTYFQLEHTLSGCMLYSKKTKLPEWGFSQQEVSCIRSGKQPNTLWYIEENSNPQVTNPERVSYSPMSFLSKFLTLQKVMWDVNKGLTEPHNWESRPESWLTLRRGINMWGENHRQVYLVGNLPIYLAIAGVIAVYVIVKALQLLLWQRNGGMSRLIGPSDATPVTASQAWAIFDHNFGSYALGWFMHYFPSFLMARQLFLHHYLASIYFGVLAIGQAFELLAERLPSKQLSKAIIAFFVAGSVIWFAWYAPLIYGFKWSKGQCEAAKFNDMDFECNLFFENKADYQSYDAGVSNPVETASSVEAPKPVETDAPVEQVVIVEENNHAAPVVPEHAGVDQETAVVVEGAA